MKNGVSGAHSCTSASERFPSQPDSRLEGRFVHVDADSSVGVNSRNEERSATKIKVCLPILRFGYGGYQSPCKTDV